MRTATTVAITTTRHHAPPARMTRAFAIDIALNILFVVIRVIAGAQASAESP